MTRRIWLGVLAGALLLSFGSRLRAQEPLGDKIGEAVERGVNYLKKQQGKDGLWVYQAIDNRDPTKLAQQMNVGSTALAGLALLESGVPAKDPVIQKAAAVVREASPQLTYTYSVSLSVMFLDRLGDPADVLLIQSLGLRLLAGQIRLTAPNGQILEGDGGWGYHCPALEPAEITRLTILAREHNQQLASGKAPIISTWPRKRLTRKDVPRTLLAQAVALLRKGGNGGNDNSNTQFGALGLYIGRRYGLPVDAALARVDYRLRHCQYRVGGWGYTTAVYDMAPDKEGKIPSAFLPEPGMRAGLVCLALGSGLAQERALAQKGKGKPALLNKDPNIWRGMVYVSTLIGDPGAKPPLLKGKDYYFMWSLERVGMIYGLRKINKKDWYAWGAQALVESQGLDGAWNGDFKAGGVDTSFALLFLCRSNLFPELTLSLKKLHKDEGSELGAIKGRTGDKKDPKKDQGEQKNPKTKPEEQEQDKAVARMITELTQASPAEQEKLIVRYQEAKGVLYTEALAGAISKLKGNARVKARAALVERMTRMTAATLHDKVQDENLEVRRAAALACARKKSPAHVPDLIGLLNDPELPVSLAAHKALVELTGKDFGPEADASRAERKEAVAKWQAWWKQQGK